MNIRDLDLNLLVVFDTVLRERSASRAAEALGVTQPTVSNALTRLRKQFRDPLFVRTAEGLTPTSRAQHLAGPVREALATLSRGLADQWLFDQASSEYHFKIAMSDYGGAVVLPELIAFIGKCAPFASVSVSSIHRTDIAAELRSGTTELAVGNFGYLADHFHEELLFEEKFVTIARSDHPDIKHELSLELFASLSHARVSHPHRRVSIVDEKLKDRGFERHVALDLHSFMSVPIVVANTDLIATIPERLAETFSRRFRIKIFKVPINAPPVTICQYWSGRMSRNPAHEWLRDTLRTVCYTL